MPKLQNYKNRQIKAKFLEAKIKGITNQYLNGDLGWSETLCQIGKITETELSIHRASNLDHYSDCIHECETTPPNYGI